MPEISPLASTVQPEGSVENIPVPPVIQEIKSSNEILCELFGAFNATPPPLDNIKINEEGSIASDKSNKKHKKHKKKHKKVKKKKRSSSSDSIISVESKKKKKKKGSSKRSDSELVGSRKKKKRKLGKFSASDTDSNNDEPKNKISKCSKEGNTLEFKIDKVKIKKEKDDRPSKCLTKSIPASTVPDIIQENILKHTVSKIVDKVIDSAKKGLTSELCKNISSVKDSSRSFVLDTPFELRSIPFPIKQEPKPHEIKITDNRKLLDEKYTKYEKKLLSENNSSDESKALGENKTAKENKASDSQLKSLKSSNGDVANTSKNLLIADVFAEDLIESGIKKDELISKPDKPKTSGGKIMIQNLKFSQVYEATVKQIEETAKAKAEKYEEGELSESSNDQERSPTPSELSDSGSVEVVELKKSPERRHRHHHKKEKHRHHERRSRSREKHHSRYKTKRSSSLNRHRDTRSQELKRSSNEERRKRTRSRERPTSRHRMSSQERKLSKERNRSRSKDRRRSAERARSKDRLKELMRSSEDKHRISSRGHSRERDKRNSEEKIDKQKLLEIARKNALNMLKGSTTGAVDQTKVSITAGGKTVNELTDFCKQLSKKDADGHESISSDTSHSSDEESASKAFHHPFQLKERPSNIVLNIRNSVALPVKSLQEKTAEQSRQLRLQFPVSSGQQHRKTENDWIPVSPKKSETTTLSTNTNTQVAVIRPKRVFKDHPDPPQPKVDIGSIVSQRLQAMRKLQENPMDSEAITQMYKAQQCMQTWAESKQEPGAFTGSTGAKVLSQAELSSGYQAWARRDQLQVAAPVSSGMGMTLLQKMGWKPGEGLGKNKEGTLQPLMLEVKMDKKGLVAQEELPVRQPHQIIRGPHRTRTLEGKHPVSLLNEYCSRRKYGPPNFELIDEAGPDHKKNFLFTVRVNGVEYKPAVGSPKKKQARAEAAEVALRALGLLTK